MKTKNVILLTAIMILLSGMSQVMAQRGNGQGYRNGENLRQGPGIACQNIPNLTDDQQTQINALKTAHMKEMQDLQNKMGELRARQKTLSTGNPDNSAINANIDEITKTQNAIMKKQAAHRAEIRKLLTDEQKVWFDSAPRGGKGPGNGPHGQGNGRGACCPMR